VIDLFFGADVRRLVNQLRLICRKPSVRRDYSRKILRELLTDVLAGFPTYRSYVNREREEISAADREAIRAAISSARRGDKSYPSDVLEFLEAALCGELEAGVELGDFIARFQQLTGPVMAKGVEDTTFYCYDRMLALNEVGCDPALFGTSPQDFHEACIISQRDWPLSMLGTSTHDTKRAEDVRCRIALLSEMPEVWAEHVRLWSGHNAPAWQGRVPDRSAEHLLYQTLVGAWPIEAERIEKYMLKACREAKTGTTWMTPDPDYEARILEFSKTIVSDEKFIGMLEEFIKPLVSLGHVNSLSQTLLKLTAPGVPDIYQGCEIWDNSLVDPDNRRPVDYSTRRKLLDELSANPAPEDILSRDHEGLPKLYLIRSALALRRRRPQDFGVGESGAYRPLLCEGTKLRHVVAYRRGGIAVVVPRLLHGLGSEWEDTTVELGAEAWTNRLDGASWSGTVRLADLFSRFPVALLESDQS
jgi:(1->4)-alpha-D-glucan 1-alpha-D-glucosylmutase